MNYTDFIYYLVNYYLTSSKLNNIDNQTLYYTMVQIW